MSIPSFTEPVADNGYRWWYLDAVSDDDFHAITVIFFIGSVFSPYYARARKRNVTPAANHCAVNVALYGAPWRWCMTERTHHSVATSQKKLGIGKSGLTINEAQNQLVVEINEIATPWPRRVRGQLTLELPNYDLDPLALDADDAANARHFWQPVAPQTRIQVSFDKPALNWQGNAYVDSNYGDVPLESSFKSWIWSRSHAPDNSTRILYDVIDQDGHSHQRSLRYSEHGEVSDFNAAQHHKLAKTRYWRIPRPARTAEGVDIDRLQTLEDTPFYSRSRFRENANGQARVTVHESLYLERFDTPWVRSLLPFRMPRRTRPLLSE